MILAAAMEALVARLGGALGCPVTLGAPPPGGGASLAIRVHSLVPVPEAARSAGRHLADQQATLVWVARLVLAGGGEDVAAQLRLLEAAALDLSARAVLGADDWRADLTLEDEQPWLQGAVLGVRMRAMQA